MGPGSHDDANCANRISQWCGDRIEYDGDPRKAEKFIEGLELNGEGVESVATPGVKCAQSQIEDDAPLDADRHTAFR